jgi:RNA polymerase sigma-70 factor (ECF subfamily)
MFSWQRSIGEAFSSREERVSVFERLLKRAKKGESEAVATLYHHFLPAVFGYIAARVPDRSTAEDLTSEVFLKMVEGIDRIRTTEEAGIAAWLLQVARATVAGYYRHREKQPHCVTLESSFEDKDDIIRNNFVTLTNSSDTDPVTCSESREEWQTVVNAINNLTEEQRLVLVGRLILGYDVATVARMVGKQANAVKALQFRALQSLNRLLKKANPPVAVLPAQRRKKLREDNQ